MVTVKKMIEVEVAYARHDEQRIVSLKIEESSTLEMVINQSDILQYFPEINLTQLKIGIFGKLKKLSDLVSEGDRIEIYRPLVIDPKEARRKRSNDQKRACSSFTSSKY